MTWRTVQEGDRGTVLAWFCGAPAAPPGWRVMTSDNPSAPCPSGLPARVALAGYSAGCQGVRAALLGPVPDPVAVATIDGTHGALPALPPVQLAAWRRLAARARAGDALWLATCLADHTYVERLPSGAYASTVRVLEAVTGLPLRATCDRPPSGVKRGGGYTGRPAECRIAHAHDVGALHVRSYHSATTDAAEHAAQVTQVFPDLWGALVVPWLGADGEPVPDTQPAGRLPPRPLGERIADVAREYLARSVRELPGAANDPQIASMLYPCRRGGTAVAGILDASGDRVAMLADSTAWCAAFRSFVLFLAGSWTCDEDRAACPHGYRISVREIVEDARHLGTLRPADGTYLPRVGDAAIWTRAGGDPLRGGTGHVATVIAVQVDGDRIRFTTIGGNEADAVRESEHVIGEPGLVAFVTCAG